MKDILEVCREWQSYWGHHDEGHHEARLMRDPRHRQDCPAPASDYEEECICPRCELCGEPSQGKKEVNGLDICDECWPHLVRDHEQAT